jgi:putative ABC transport system permease protein
VQLATIAVKNVYRNRLRTLLTALGVGVALLMFIALRTTNWSWTAAEKQSASDRIGVRHKITFIMTLPKRYAEEIKAVPGITAASYANWFGAKDPKNESDFFATIAVEPEDLLDVYREIEVPADQVEAWKQNRRGALVGDALAKKKGWKVGDRVTLRGTIYPGDWEFHVSGIYTSKRASIDRSTLWFHWKYLNENVTGRRRDQIGWVVARVADPGQSAQICRTIDQKFSERDIQTLSMSERAMQASFLGMLSAILRAIDVVSVVILLIMMLILGNTIAMGVRDRTGEYGVLRAIGFKPQHIVLFVIGEALVIGLLGGAIGVGLSYPLVENGMGRFLEENMGAIFPYFRVQPALAAIAMGLALLASVVAAAIPAYRASKLKVVDSLRRVG